MLCIQEAQTQLPALFSNTTMDGPQVLIQDLHSNTAGVAPKLEKKNLTKVSKIQGHKHEGFVFNNFIEFTAHWILLQRQGEFSEISILT